MSHKLYPKKGDLLQPMKILNVDHFLTWQSQVVSSNSFNAKEFYFVQEYLFLNRTPDEIWLAFLIFVCTTKLIPSSLCSKHLPSLQLVILNIQLKNYYTMVRYTTVNIWLDVPYFTQLISSLLRCAGSFIYTSTAVVLCSEPQPEFSYLQMHTFTNADLNQRELRKAIQNWLYFQAVQWCFSSSKISNFDALLPTSTICQSLCTGKRFVAFW